MAHFLNPVDITALPAWPALHAQRQAMQHFNLREAFASDAQRFERYSLESCGLFLDYSKNLIDEQSLALLLQLAEQAGLPQAIGALFEGAEVNTSERRPALHTALRRPVGQPLYLQGTDLMPQVHQVLQQMTELVARIHNGLWRGYSEQAITDVVNIGIGGSFLGPQLVSEALQPFNQKGVHCHYLANIDGSEFREVTAQLNAATTLFIVSSKSFSTLETLKNAEAARAWYFAQGGSESGLHRHFVAVTSHPQAAIDFGMRAENIFPLWDWVGGRYSLWSAIGLPIALATSFDIYQQLLAGARDVDEHFASAPLQENIPLLLALLEIWYVNFWGCSSIAVLPYDHNLRLLPDHLQQLTMESNGKRVDHNGTELAYNSCPVLWGSAGTIGQHSFHQLLHQGTWMIPVDFILPLSSHEQDQQQHAQVVANCLAQAQTLMNGQDYDAVVEQLARDGLDRQAIEALAPHKVMPGNRPSTLITTARVTPEALGSLIALYEHKTFAASVILGINAFDQWGVELGKKAAISLYDDLLTGDTQTTDTSAATVIAEYYTLHHKN
jgi:glucose-6-phosphate isomerase